MNYFCDSGGVIFHVDPERVFQGSANANEINFFGAFPSNAEVLLAYRLPDGTWTTPQRMTPIVQLSGVLDGKGNAYAGWQTRIGARLKMSNGAPVTDENGNYVYEPDYTITAKYGTVLVQFFVYANAGNGLGAQIATANSSFLVEKGVPIVLPDTPTDDYEALLGQILAAISDKNLQIDTNTENITVLQNDLQETNEQVTLNGQAIHTLTLSVENGLVASVVLSLNDNYVLTATYLAKDGSVLGLSQVDFPVESMVVSGGYDNENKTIILTLQNGNVVAIPVGDLVDGLISSTEKGQPNGVATLGADGKVPSEQLPAGQGGAPDLSEYVKFIDFATTNNAGVVKINNALGIRIDASGSLYLDTANDTEIAAQQGNNAIKIYQIPQAVKSGLVKHDNITLTDEDQTNACDWLGAVKKLPTAASGEKGKLYSNKYNNATQGYDVQVDNYNEAGKYAVPSRASNGAIYIPDTACKADGAIPDGQVAVNANYVDNLPDNLTLTNDTQEEDGTVTEGTKTKWQKWLGINSGAGGGTKIYQHTYYFISNTTNNVRTKITFKSTKGESLLYYNTSASNESEHGYNVDLYDKSIFDIRVQNDSQVVTSWSQTYYTTWVLYYYVGSSNTYFNVYSWVGDNYKIDEI